MSPDDFKYRKISTLDGSRTFTRRQWAQLYLAQLVEDHGATLEEYLDEVPAADRDTLRDEVLGIVRTIKTHRGFRLIEGAK